MEPFFSIHELRGIVQAGFRRCYRIAGEEWLGSGRRCSHVRKAHEVPDQNCYPRQHRQKVVIRSNSGHQHHQPLGLGGTDKRVFEG